MAFDLDPIKTDPIPAQTYAQKNRNLSLEISSPFGEVPTITFTRETVKVDGDGELAGRISSETDAVTAEQFVEIVPEYKVLLQSIPLALDLLAQRLPDYRKKHPAQEDA